MSDPPPPTIDAINDLMRLGSHPNASPISSSTIAYRQRLTDTKAVMAWSTVSQADRRVAHAEALRQLVDASMTRIREAAPDILEAMITRALGEGRDAQRAAERLLEEIGVLVREHPIGTDGVERVDLIAARVFYRQPTVSVARLSPESNASATEGLRDTQASDTGLVRL